MTQQFSRADTEDDPIGKHDPERGEGLRDDGGLVAKRRRQHACADCDPRRNRAERAKPCEQKGSMTDMIFHGWK